MIGILMNIAVEYDFGRMNDGIKGKERGKETIENGKSTQLPCPIFFEFSRLRNDEEEEEEERG